MGGKSNRGRSKIKAPVERLAHNHRRIELRLAELCEHTDAIFDGGKSTGQHWDGVDDVVAYLQRAVVRHELDEEESVFPYLAKHPALRPLLQRLRDDHVSQGKKVAELSVLAGDRDEQSAKKLQRIAKSLQTLYLDHIKREDRELLPAIERYLSRAQIDKVAQEMADRRD